MALTLHVDAEDRMATVHQVNAMADRDAGTIVAHAPPAPFGQRLPQDVLRGLGCDPASRDWPTGSAAWELARAWCNGFDIKRLIVYGAWRLRERDLDQLVRMSDVDGLEVCLVTLDQLEMVPLAGRVIAQAPVSDLLSTGPAADSGSERKDPLAELGPLPVAPIPRFLAECCRLIEDQDVRSALESRYAVAFNEARRNIDTSRVRETAVAHLADAFTQARTPNDVLIGWRSTQAAALSLGWLLECPLVELTRTVAGLIDTAASPCRDWPLPRSVQPLGQAAAALALATQCDQALLTSVTTTDLDADCSAVSIAGSVYPLDPSLRPPIRAQRWLRQQRHREAVELLSNQSRPMQPAALQRMLERVGGSASRAPRARTRLIDGLKRTLLVHDVRDGPPRDGREPCRVPAHPYGRYGQSVWFDHVQDQWRFASSERSQLAALRYVRGDFAGFVPGRGPEDERVEDRVRRLHATIVRAGGVVDRLSLHVALGWSVERLAEAVSRLNEALVPIGAVVLELPDGILELRAYEDHRVRDALEALAARRISAEGLTPSLAHLYYRLAISPGKRLRLAHLGDPGQEGDLDELRAIGVVSIDGDAVVLTDNAVAALCGRCHRSADLVVCR